MEPLKNCYNDTFFAEFLNDLITVYPSFNRQKFLKEIFDASWENRELKDRMHHISTTLRTFLPAAYAAALEIILNFVMLRLKKHGAGLSFEYMFLADFIEQFGLDNEAISLRAMETVTQYTSCEFAIRSFILHAPKRVMKTMNLWSQHKNEHVRRLSSEGCRPRLPWAMALPLFKKDPSELLPILECLKDDPSAYVRKSVANNINDISKDNPDFVIELVRRWRGQSEKTDWILKHASRTLLKEGNAVIMSLFGYASADSFSLENFNLTHPKIKVGEELEFSFKVQNLTEASASLRLEYAVYFLLANGKHGRKVFKISERSLAVHEKLFVVKTHSFRVISTRKYYNGEHAIAPIVNGVELKKEVFLLSTEK